MLYDLEIAAANLILNNDLRDEAANTHKPAKNVARKRTLAYAGLTGSAAAFDMAIELRAGGKPFATLRNTTTGAMANNQEMFAIGYTCPPGLDFEAIVIDAGGTNPAYLKLLMDE